MRQAQNEVLIWEKRLSEAQLKRREQQSQIRNLQSLLKEIHLDLDRTSRGEDKYLQLITEEHKLIKKERELLRGSEELENIERDTFHQLSMSIRSSREWEKEYTEKAKWWGVSTWLVGGLIGTIGATINFAMRPRKVIEKLETGANKMNEMATVFEENNARIVEFMTDMRTALQLEGTQVKNPSSQNDVKKVSDFDELIQTIKNENARLSQEMKELSRLAKLEAALDADPTAVVYVGSDMERLLEQTEKNIESKMKLRTLITVVVIYTAVAVTAPWLYAVFRGD